MPKSETDLIQEIRQSYSLSQRALIKGIGDDSAVLAGLSRSQRFLCTTDLLIERVHFDLRFTSPYLVGKKSLAVNLSDIAAMGGDPLFYTVSLAIPKKQVTRFIREFYKGLHHLATEYKVTLIGGDLSDSPSDIFICLTVLGKAEKNEVIYRSNARSGDQIFVTGTLGGSATGLRLLKTSYRLKSAKADIRRAIAAHLSPTPRCDVGRWLAENRLPSSMIDISDGLSTDLHHLCRESRVGAVIYEDLLPISEVTRALEKNPTAVATGGGEDYELLFTVPAKKVRHLVAKYPSRLPPITRIGEILNKQSGVGIVTKDGSKQPFEPVGYDHFST